MTILIIPTISEGNIPQLAVDLLIYSLGAKFVKILDDTHLYPFVGPRDGAQGSSYEDAGAPPLSTPIELYETEDKSLALIQIRAPTLPRSQTNFVTKTLIPLIHDGAYSEVIVAGSSNAGMQHNIEPNHRIKLYGDGVSKRLEQLTINAGSQDKLALLPSKDLPESGFLKKIFEHELDPVVPLLGAVIFAYEGDNFGDAEQLAEQLVILSGSLKVTEWVQPESWKGVYGREIPSGIEEGLYA